VQKPHKGCFGRSVLRYRSGEAGRRLTDTLRCELARRVIARAGEARERSPGEVQGKVFAGKP
jgi:hypothetical protein